MKAHRRLSCRPVFALRLRCALQAGTPVILRPALKDPSSNLPILLAARTCLYAEVALFLAARTCLYAEVALFLAVKTFQRESVLFRS